RGGGRSGPSAGVASVGVVQGLDRPRAGPGRGARRGSAGRRGRRGAQPGVRPAPRAMTVAGRPPTIRDVARAAGVSKSTVSNVIRDAGKTSADTRERVLAAIADVGYRPNAIARSLVRRRTTTVGILVGDLANPFYSELAKLVEQRLTAEG